MPKKKRPTYLFSPKEFQRLREIQFYFLIRTLMKLKPDPGFIYDFVESFGTLFDLTTLHLQKAVRDTIMESEALRPDPTETVILLYMAGAPMKTVMLMSRRGQSTVYKLLKEYGKDPCEYMPRYGYNETETISKFMSSFREMSTTVFHKEEVAHDGP